MKTSRLFPALLARRALAAGFRWEAAVLLETGDRLICQDNVHWHAGASGRAWTRYLLENMGDDVRGTVLDFNDPTAATLGVLLRQVREARKAPGFCVVSIEHDRIEEHTEPYVPSCPTGSIWWTWHGSGLHDAHLPFFRTEAEALIAALEAAKEKPRS